MTKRQLILLMMLLVSVLLCGLGLMVEWQTKMLRRAFDNYILDNENHYLPCHQLPTPEEVERVVAEHQDVIQQIEAVNPGQVGVEIDTITCPGHADLLIWYASRTDRLAIKAIIGTDTFFGIPYRLQNR